VISDFGLDFWLAQTYGIEMENLPKHKPEHLEKAAYEFLKR
jgi:hypothetical protein